MESPQKDPGYISYQDYGEVKKQFDRTLKIENDKKRFEEIIKTISDVPKTQKFREDILTKLHNVLSNFPAFMKGIGPNYCRYINLWLNKEVKKLDGHVKRSYFDIFGEFSDELSYKISNNYHNSCKQYIFNLDHETINIMDILYGLYDEYDKIKSLRENSYYDSCEKFLLWAKNHNDAIDNYYEKNIKLYNKFDGIKNLINNLKMQSNHPCIKKIYLNTPKEVIRLQEEEKKKAAEKQEQEQRAQEQEQRAREQKQREREQEEQLKSVLALTGDVSNTLRLFGTTENDVLSSMLHSPEEGLSENSISPRGQQYLDGNKFKYPQTHLLDTFGRQKEELEQLDVKSHELKSNHISETFTPGVFGSLQNSISSFIREVEPGPVLGVSGGMGVLFLLFKYTPVGSFFGGRRGRFRQIPRSFNGPFPGEFPNFQEYGGGYVGYSPMDINPLAE